MLLTFTDSPCFSISDEKSTDIQMKMCEVPFPRDFSFKEIVIVQVVAKFCHDTPILKPIHCALTDFQKSGVFLGQPYCKGL